MTSPPNKEGEVILRFIGSDSADVRKIYRVRLISSYHRVPLGLEKISRITPQS
jgi:hypothetical protein